MSSITADGMAAPAASSSASEQSDRSSKSILQYANYRAVTGGTEVSKTHWHIASPTRSAGVLTAWTA